MVETVIDCDVAPFDQRLFVAYDDVSVTLPPAQNVVGPLAVIVGAEGRAMMLVVVEAGAETQPLPSTTETV